MKYKVIYPFIENGKKYWLGDIYVNKDDKRIKQLTSANNNLKRKLIEPVKEDTAAKDAVKTKRQVDGGPEVKAEDKAND